MTSRADVARLTLRLRSVQREASEAEATAASMQRDGLNEVSARLDTLIEQRRQVFVAELERVRTEALGAIAEARRDADEFLARHAPQPKSRVPQPIAPVTVHPQHPTPPATTPNVSRSPWAAEPSPPPAEQPDPIWAPAAPTMPTAPTMPPAAAVPAVSPTVLIDAEAFARVFANMVGQVIEERTSRQQSFAMPMAQMAQMAQMAHVVPPAKQGFWTHARHVDVMLLGVTMVIALVVLAAWLA